MSTRARPRIAGPAFATAIMLVLLIGLGVWQVRRLAWKEGILAEIDRAEGAAPVPLGADLPPRFSRISVVGVVRPGSAGLYGARVESVGGVDHMGGQLLGLLDPVPAGAPLLVDFGWVPTDLTAPVSLPSTSAPVSLVGYMRPAEKSGFLSASDDVAGRRFYALNPAVIAPALGAATAAPFTFVVMGLPPARGYPMPAESLPRPVNNHLQYALTWFGLAGVLAVIFAIWVRGLKRA